jgi:hypothetical protein
MMWVAAVCIVATGQIEMRYSYDGITWKLATVPASTFIVAAKASVVWNGVVWICGSTASFNTSTIISSFNGITWTEIPIPITTTITALLWDGNKWIASGPRHAGGGNQNNSIYNTNPLGRGTWTPFVFANMNNLVQSIAYNGKIYVSVGTSSPSISYSYDGLVWTAVTNSIAIINGTGVDYPSVQWLHNRFVIFGKLNTTSRIAISYDGTTWTPIPNISTLVQTKAIGGASSLQYQQHQIKFASNLVLYGNNYSITNGVDWNQYALDVSNIIIQPKSIATNGKEFVFAGLSTVGATNKNYFTNTLFDASAYTPIQHNSDLSANIVSANQYCWLMGGKTNTTNNLLKSHDGITWHPISLPTANEINGIANNDSVWVVSASGSPILYSTQVTSPTTFIQTTQTGGGPVQWANTRFICGVDAVSTTVAYSANGITWSQQTIGSFGKITSIASNEYVWLITTDTSILISRNGTTWTQVGGTGLSYTSSVWTGLSFVVATTTNTLRYSYNGTTWTNVTPPNVTGPGLAWIGTNIGSINIETPIILGGEGNNIIAYSRSGLFYQGLQNTTITTRCRTVSWNGTLWVAGGEGTNTLAYSFDGLRWVGLGTTIFSTACYGVEWNGSLWVAVGSGTNTIATSLDGKVWTGRGQTIFTSIGRSVAWNGTVWAAVGTGTNTIATSTDGITWTGQGSATLTDGFKIKWLGTQWFATGSGTNVILTTSVRNAANGWTSVATSTLMTKCNSIGWNGFQYVAVGEGTNTIATSLTGTTWTGIGATIFTTGGNDVDWIDNRWILVGAGTNQIVTTYDKYVFATNLVATPSNFTQVFGIGSMKKTVIPVTRNLYFNTNDKLTISGPNVYDAALTQDTAIAFKMNLP